MTTNNIIGLLLLSFIIFSACTRSETYTPKPKGYFRIEMPSPKYKTVSDSLNLLFFNINDNADCHYHAGVDTQRYLLTYPGINAKLDLSIFFGSSAELQETINDMRRLVSMIARNPKSVSEQTYNNPQTSVFGTVLFLDEESPSPVQFVLTDSISRVMRGSLYFECRMNADSLRPIADYLRADVIELIQSLNWNK